MQYLNYFTTVEKVEKLSNHNKKVLWYNLRNFYHSSIKSFKINH